MITLKDIKASEEVNIYIEKADKSLTALGYTEHSFTHVAKVSDDAAMIMTKLGYPERTIELTKIAGYMHDIGNIVNRYEHSQSGAIMAFYILREMGMFPQEISEIVTAIGNHDEGTGVPVSPIAAAIIIADKSDVRRSRVRNISREEFDIHDRVNYSVETSHLEMDVENKKVKLMLEIDETQFSVIEYFEIFMERMLLCRKSAQTLGIKFELYINGHFVA